MHDVNLASLDLNLLVALDALLRERHVTRAARRIGLSQSAMSHALGRLREALGDPLLVRGRGRMVATPRAEALEVPLRETLGRLAELLGGGGFDPATDAATFRIACADYLAVRLLPPLLARLRETAPHVDLDLRNPGPTEVVAGLERGAIDLALGVFAELPATMHRTHLLDDGFACVVRRDHPRVGHRLTLKRFAELPHALIGVGEPGPTAVDRALAERGLSRRIALRIEHFLAAPLIVARSDLVLTLPAGLARELVAIAPLVAHPPPIPLRPFTFHAIWHARQQHDPAHAFLRAEIAAASAALDGRRG